MMSSANCVGGSRPPVRTLTEAAVDLVARVSLGWKLVLFLFDLKSAFLKKRGGGKRRCGACQIN